MADEEDPEEDTSNVVTSQPEIPKLSREPSKSSSKRSNISKSSIKSEAKSIESKTSSPQNGSEEPTDFAGIKQESVSKTQHNGTEDKKEDSTQDTKSSEQLKTEREAPASVKGERTSAHQLELQKSRTTSRLYSKERHCQRRFREMIGKRELRKEELEKQQGDLRQRLDVLECSMPAVMVWNIWRMAQGAPISSLQRVIEKQFQGPASGEVFCPSTPSRHYDCRVREIEAERKQAQKRAEEARTLWTEKMATLEERKQKLEEAKKIQEERKERIKQLTKEAKELKDSLVTVENDGFCEAGECGDIKCKQRWLDKVSSASSIRSNDVECLERLQELAETELEVKRQIADLERREEAYMRTLQQADELWSKMEGDAASTMSALQEQLEMKTAANQQLADRICQLEDDLEKMRSRMASCRNELEKFLSVEKIEAIIGKDDDFAEVADKAAGFGIQTEDRKSGREGDLADALEKGTLAKNETMDQETLAKIKQEAMDEEVLAKVDYTEASVGGGYDVYDKMVSARPDLVDLGVDRPDLVSVEDAKLGIRPEDFVREQQRFDEASEYLAQLGSLEELDYDDDYGVCAPDFACNDVVFTETGMDDAELAALESKDVKPRMAPQRQVDETAERQKTIEPDEEFGTAIKPEALHKDVEGTMKPEELYRDVEEKGFEPSKEPDRGMAIKTEEHIPEKVDAPQEPVYEEQTVDGEDLEDKIRAEDLPIKKDRSQISEDRVIKRIPEQEKPETVPAMPAPFSEYDSRGAKELEIERDNIVVPRNDLLSWLDTVNLVRETIVKCPDCSNVKKNADKLANKIAAYTGSEVPEVTKGGAMPERIELDVKDEMVEERVSPTESEAKVGIEVKVEPSVMKDATEIEEVEVTAEVPSSEVAMDATGMSEKVEELKKETEPIIEAEIERTELKEKAIIKPTEEIEATDSESVKPDREPLEVMQETNLKALDTPSAVETITKIGPSKEQRVDEAKEASEYPSESQMTPVMKDIQEKEEEVLLPEQVTPKMAEMEEPEERAKIVEEEIAREDQEKREEEVKEVPVEEVQEDQEQLVEEKEMGMEVSKMEVELQEKEKKVDEGKTDETGLDSIDKEVSSIKERIAEKEVAEKAEEIGKAAEKAEELAKEAGEAEAKEIPLEGEEAEAKEIPFEGEEAEAKEIPLEGEEAEVKEIPLEGEEAEVKEIPLEGEEAKVKEIPLEGEEAEKELVPSEEIELKEEPMLPPEMQEIEVVKVEKEALPDEEIEKEAIEDAEVKEEVPSSEVEEEIKEAEEKLTEGEVPEPKEETDKISEKEGVMEDQMIEKEEEEVESVTEKLEQFEKEAMRPIDSDLVAKPYLAVADIEEPEEEEEFQEPPTEAPCVCESEIYLPPIVEPPMETIKKIEITQTEIIHTETIEVITQTASSVATQTLPAQKIIKRTEQPRLATIPRAVDQESEVLEQLLLRKLLRDQSTVTAASAASQTQKSSPPRSTPRGIEGSPIPHIFQSVKTERLDQEHELRSINYAGKSAEIEKAVCNCCMCGKVAPVSMKPRLENRTAPGFRATPTRVTPRNIPSPRLCPDCKVKRLEKGRTPEIPVKRKIKKTTCDKEVCTCTPSSSKLKVPSSQKKIRTKRDQGCMAKIPKPKIEGEKRKQEASGVEKSGENDEKISDTDSLTDCIYYETITGESGKERRLNCSCGNSD